MYVQTGGTLYYMPQRANPRSMTELVEIFKMVMLGEVNTVYCSDIGRIGDSILKKVLKPYSSSIIVDYD